MKIKKVPVGIIIFGIIAAYAALNRLYNAFLFAATEPVNYTQFISNSVWGLIIVIGLYFLFKRKKIARIFIAVGLVISMISNLTMLSILIYGLAIGYPFFSEKAQEFFK